MLNILFSERLMKFTTAFLKLRQETELQFLGSSFFQSFITQGKKEFLNYSILQGKAVNRLGCLRECLIEGTKSWIYFETLLERVL